MADIKPWPIESSIEVFMRLQMVSGLLILHTSPQNGRSIWWPIDPFAASGYNLYRAFDAPVNWQKLNTTPIPGQFYQDKTTLRTVRFPVTADSWVDNGEFGMRCFKLPETPYSEVVKGRAVVATHPSDVLVEITDTSGKVTVVRPLQVQGMDQLVFLDTGTTLPVGGAVTTFPVVNYDTVASISAVYKGLSNYVDLYFNLARCYYTVVPVDALGNEQHAPGAYGSDVADSMSIEKMDFIFAEMIRRNAWLFEQVGEPAYLLMRRTAGVRCGCSPDFAQGRTGCPVCFEVGIQGGFFGPFDILFIDPDVAAVRTVSEGGIKVERQSRSFLGRSPIIQDGDLIVRHNGERLVVSGVTYKLPRGVLCQQEFSVSLLPTGDTRYLIPIVEPDIPILYNPAVQPPPGSGPEGANPLGAQPVFSTDNLPEHKQWLGKPMHGRTVSFGRIQG